VTVDRTQLRRLLETEDNECLGAVMRGALPALLDQLDTYQEALTLLIEKAEQYFDTGRGDLDGAVAFARAALAVLEEPQ
jgi:predicted negative regulator of RcsB-dependent stress response